MFSDNSGKYVLKKAGVRMTRLFIENISLLMI